MSLKSLMLLVVLFFVSDSALAQQPHPALDPVGAAAQLGAAFEVGKHVYGLQAFTACAFSQSFRNFSRPMFVRGWLNS